jgi:predicted ArsR family transcriptional regulator
MKGSALASLAATVMMIQKAPRTQKELATLLGTTRASICRHLQVLVDEGLIEKRECVSYGDGRRARRYYWI